jgi:hypothetical protein
MVKRSAVQIVLCCMAFRTHRLQVQLPTFRVDTEVWAKNIDITYRFVSQATDAFAGGTSGGVFSAVSTPI